MRVQPARPRSPLTTTVTERCGARSAACSAAQRPAPPAPRIRMSVSTTSMAPSAETLTGHLLLLLLDVDSDHGELPLASLTLHLVDGRGQLRGAVGRGCRPEVEQDHVPGEIREGHPPPVETEEREGRRLAAHQREEPGPPDQRVELGLHRGRVAIPLGLVLVVEPRREPPPDLPVLGLLALPLVLVVDLGGRRGDAHDRGQRQDGHRGPDTAGAHETLTSAVPSNLPWWVSKKVTLSTPASLARNGNVKVGFSPMEVEVSNSAMSRPR